MIWFLPAALANTWIPRDGGFLGPGREEAPTDAVLLYSANYGVGFRAVDGDGNVQYLTATPVTGVGAEPVVAIAPPPGGWGAGATWELTRTSDGYEDYVDEDAGLPREITFTTGIGPALPAVEPELFDDVVVSAWSGAGSYAWGCCVSTRTVEVPVVAAHADPWARIEIVGEFDLGRPSQITTEEVHTHLDVGVGPGGHVLKLTQWLDNDVPQPPCFSFVSVSAAGVAGPSETICTDEDGLVEDPAEEPTGAGCTTGPTVPGWVWLAAIPWARRRTKRTTPILAV